ncbi:alpha/beta hydrolase [Bacillus pumilus]|uniref:alpha/beta hydrolase fold domain-containing protein n=1 Tax=Bacillus pumilus TaxID=1408 RepID=UPI00017A600C|nr:alpha/beta hydrolase [Bacillus pumilus]EDW23581.1 esterase [Bacillus pumilus ATCC 7061]MCR4355537.1 alpha/beta hydrolase [Bacillus pumilus]MCY7506164.1 alpha/beta hydrolase [Bacillus pumilus]MDR4270097.1 alpha/beta hydrolase [Bacillus pumilus]MED4630200.1 alpha/beta hydrolase [Bacillus pumilus]
MSVEIYHGERSEESIQFETLFASQSNKESFSSIEHKKKFLEQKGMENTQPYAIGDDVKLMSEVQEQTFDGMQVFTLNEQASQNQKVILYLHGGAWTNQPLNVHWWFMDKMAQSLGAKVVAPIYPKVPHYSYQDTYPKILNLYKDLLKTAGSANQLTIMGDSAGGNISLGLAHLLKKEDLPQPKDIILLSACVDMSLSNPLMFEYAKKDPILGYEGMEAIAKIWTADQHVTDPLISPIYGEFKGLAKITHFIGTHDMLYPDAIKLDEKLTEQGIDIKTFVYPEMLHVFVVMPIPEAQDAQEKIIQVINR